MTRVLRFIWLLPRNALVVVLRAYRAVISPIYGDVCRYYPSCSAYALGSVQQHGVVRGVALSAWRLARCHPWAAGGVEDVRPRTVPLSVSPFGFVTTDANPVALHFASAPELALAHHHSHGKG